MTYMECLGYAFVEGRNEKTRAFSASSCFLSMEREFGLTQGPIHVDLIEDDFSVSKWNEQSDLYRVWSKCGRIRPVHAWFDVTPRFGVNPLTCRVRVMSGFRVWM